MSKDLKFLIDTGNISVPVYFMDLGIIKMIE
jgi:hypothetical protein